MTDAQVIVGAGAVWIGASLAIPVPLTPVLVLFGVSLIRRSPWLVAVALLLTSSTLAARAAARLDVELPTHIDEVMQVRTDPRATGSTARLVMDTSAGRMEARVAPGLGGRLHQLEVGDRIRMSGVVRPWTGSEGKQAVHHLVGTISVSDIGQRQPAKGHWRLVNTYRRLIRDGADDLRQDRAELYVGLVYGDDRQQAPETVADFRAAGLTHLLAVSGQNVAFVLVLARPLLETLGFRVRFTAVLALLFLFGAATRFEPSVLRAIAMAAAAATADLLGRDSSTRRNLALAVGALLLWDPLLVRSLGFRLSVAASSGIAVLAQPIAEGLPGPRVVREPLATTVAAQIAVAPLLVATFGPMPLASLPANLLAGPAAGPVMMWGLTGGALAGALGAPLAWFLMLPVRPLLWWLSTVARESAGAGMGWVDATGCLALAVGLVAWLLSGPRHRRVVAVGVCGLLAALTPQPPGTAAGSLVPGPWRLGVVVNRHDDPGPRRQGGPRRGAVRPARARHWPGRSRRGDQRLVAISSCGRDTPTLAHGRRCDRPDVGTHPGKSGVRGENVGRRRLVLGVHHPGRGNRGRRAHTTTARRDTLPPVKLELGPYGFDITTRALVMGILNRTPDSFFDGGSYFDFDAFLRQAERHVVDGADFLDVGGVKAGPGREVTVSEELDRVVPAVAQLRARFDLPISVDTFRAEVARECYAAGANVGNDISGFADPDYLAVAAKAGASVVACHIRTAPRVPDPAPVYTDVVADVCAFLAASAADALAAGIPRERIMVDAGLDLGKTPDMSAELLRRHEALLDTGFAVFLSASNKGFLGELTNTDVADRREATLAAHALGISKGVRILRAHDVKGSRRVADVMSAVLAA